MPWHRCSLYKKLIINQSPHPSNPQVGFDTFPSRGRLKVICFQMLRNETTQNNFYSLFFCKWQVNKSLPLEGKVPSLRGG